MLKENFRRLVKWVPLKEACLNSKYSQYHHTSLILALYDGVTHRVTSHLLAHIEYTCPALKLPDWFLKVPFFESP